MTENKCKGCIYDVEYDDIATNEEKFNAILNNCCSCKRAMKEEYKDSFADLYKAQE
jgi:hypothetical protein